jgi:hypothetical protein
MGAISPFFILYWILINKEKDTKESESREKGRDGGQRRRGESSCSVRGFLLGCYFLKTETERANNRNSEEQLTRIFISLLATKVASSNKPM